MTEQPMTVYESVAEHVRRAALHLGDSAMPRDAGDEAFAKYHAQALFAIELLAIAYRYATASDWTNGTWAALREVDHEDLTMFAVFALRELIRHGFDGVEAIQRAIDE